MTTSDEKPVVGGSEYRYMDARGRLSSQTDPAILKKWALMDELRDPEMAKAIVQFCDNLTKEMVHSECSYTPDIMIRIIEVALGSMLGGK